MIRLEKSIPGRSDQHTKHGPRIASCRVAYDEAHQ
jgi:hypothetical protein